MVSHDLLRMGILESYGSITRMSQRCIQEESLGPTEPTEIVPAAAEPIEVVLVAPIHENNQEIIDVSSSSEVETEESSSHDLPIALRTST